MAKSKAVSTAKKPLTVKSFLSKDRISDSEDDASTTNENEKEPRKTNGVSQKKSRTPQPKNTVPLSRNSASDSDSDSDNLDASEEEEDKIDKLIPRIPIVSPRTLKDVERIADGQRSSEALSSGKNIGNAKSKLQAKEKDTIEISSDSSSSDSTSEEESENEGTLHSTNVGSGARNGTQTNQNGRIETMQENEQSLSKSQVPLQTPKAINVRLMKPPTGYTPLAQAATGRNTTIPDLSGKQIFYVSVPSHLSTVLPTTISGESLSNGALFLRHGGNDFIIRSDEDIGGVPQTLNVLLPSSDAEGTFTFARQTVPQTLHLALHVNLSHLIHKQADPLTLGDDSESDSEHEVAGAAQFQLPRNERTEATTMDISDTSETSVESGEEEEGSVPSSSRSKKRKAEERAEGLPSSQQKKRRTHEQAESVPSSRGEKREIEQQAKRKEESGRTGVQRKESSGKAKEDANTNSVPKKIKNREGGDGKKKAKKKDA